MHCLFLFTVTYTISQFVYFLLLNIHFRITDIKYNSPAHISGKIEHGDEIIQINYQTVVGWQYKRVLQQLQESPPDVLLTLKKRPRHTKIYGQIYMKPYRLPSKKRSIPYRFGENLPSPRIEFIPSQNFPVLLPLTEKSDLIDSDSSSSSSISIPAETTKSNDKDIRLYLSKPRAVLHRRNTICGDQFSGFRGNITFWHEMNVRNRNIEGNSLRDKSVSFGFGLEISLDKRPITCIGIGHNNNKFGDLGNVLKGSLPDMKTGDKGNISDVNDNVIPQRNEVKSGSLDEVKGKHELKTKVVKFNTSQEEKTRIYETNEDENITRAMKEKHCKQNEDNEANIELPNLPTKLKITCSPGNDTGLAEAINVILIKNTHEPLEKNKDDGKIIVFYYCVFFIYFSHLLFR